jgi:hypothetical protein
LADQEVGAGRVAASASVMASSRAAAYSTVRLKSSTKSFTVSTSEMFYG